MWWVPKTGKIGQNCLVWQLLVCGTSLMDIMASITENKDTIFHHLQPMYFHCTLSWTQNRGHNAIKAACLQFMPNCVNARVRLLGGQKGVRDYSLPEKGLADKNWANNLSKRCHNPKEGKLVFMVHFELGLATFGPRYPPPLNGPMSTVGDMPLCPFKGYWGSRALNHASRSIILNQQ